MAHLAESGLRAKLKCGGFRLVGPWRRPSSAPYPPAFRFRDGPEKASNFIPYSQLDAYMEEMSHIEDELVLHSVQLAASMKILLGRFKRQLRRQRTLSGLQIQMKNRNLLHLTLAFAASRPMSVVGHSRPMHSVPVPINVRCYSNRWGNRPAFLWIAEDFGCCASG